MSIITIVDNIKEEEWNQLLNEFEDANYYHTWSYGKILWGENNLSHIVIKSFKKVISIAQVRIIKIPFSNKGMAYITGGPLWRKTGEPENIEYFKIVIKVIKNEYVKKRGLYLRIAPNIFEHRKDLIYILTTEGYIYNDNLPKYRTIIIDLEKNIQDLRRNLDQKWRNQLNRSEKNNLEIKSGSGDELFNIFLKLQIDMLSRKKYKTNINYYKYKQINNDLPEYLKLYIIVCFHNNEPVSSTIITKMGDTAIYLLGATGKNGLDAKSSYLLQWHAIQYLKNINCKWYDLGGINPDDNPGVYHFKRGITGRDIKYIGQYDLCNSIMLKLLFRVADKIRLGFPIIFQKLCGL